MHRMCLPTASNTICEYSAYKKQIDKKSKPGSITTRKSYFNEEQGNQSQIDMGMDQFPFFPKRTTVWGMLPSCGNVAKRTYIVINCIFTVIMQKNFKLM